MRTRRAHNTCLIQIIILITAILVLKKLDLLPSWKNIFSSKPVVIDETPILIKEIKALGQVITATVFGEVVVDSTVIMPRRILPAPHKQLVLIARGKVLAGIDLKLLTDKNVTVKKDTVWMQLPTAKIIEVIINPGDYETFVEDGDWNPEDVTAVKLKARLKITDKALSQNIIDKANTKAKAILEDFLHAAGFKIVFFSQ
jgi:hypothetical protein